VYADSEIDFTKIFLINNCCNREQQ